MKKGARIAYVPDAEIVHVHEESWSRIRNRYYREAIALKHIEPHISFGLMQFFWLTSSNIVSDIRTAWRKGKFRSEARGIVLFRVNQFWGTYKGHRFDAPVTRDLRNRFYFPASRDKAAPQERRLTPAERTRALQIDYSEQ